MDSDKLMQGLLSLASTGDLLGVSTVWGGTVERARVAVPSAVSGTVFSTTVVGAVLQAFLMSTIAWVIKSGLLWLVDGWLETEEADDFRNDETAIAEVAPNPRNRSKTKKNFRWTAVMAIRQNN